jgi:hypothetical protein
MTNTQTELQQPPDWNRQEIPQVTNGKRIESWFEHNAGVYWLPSKRGNYIKYNETGLKRCLKAAGFLSKPYGQQRISEMDSEILRIQDEQNVDYAGPFAGYPTGICNQYENRVLVTEARNVIAPAPGTWAVLSQLFENLFKDPGYRDQRPFIFGWIKTAIECLSQGQFRPGQLLVIAGERDCGKSLCQNLITKLFGGRAARPYRYMSGQTTFNGDLIGAEHLIIEDDAGSTDIRVRRQFGSKIKELTVNELQSCHPKHCNAFPARLFWRVSASLNCEPENLATLPPLDDSLLDKIILLKALKHDLPMKTRTHAEREAFWNTMMAELPAFIDYLLKWKIPVELESPRFGITHYHHGRKAGDKWVANLGGATVKYRIASVL